MALAHRHKKAVDNYMRGMNKKDAMLEAGYSKSMASTRVCDVFDREDVKAEIERRQKIAAHRSDVDLDWIVERLKAIADADLDDALEFYSDGSARVRMDKLTPELKKALTKFEVHEYTEGRGKNAAVVKANKIGLADKLRALELLVRHLGLSKEKQHVEHSGEVSVVERLHRGRTRAGLGAGNSEEEDAE